MLIVRMLDQEGFSALAGELLTEISLGRELDLDDGQGTGSENSAVSSESIVPEISLRRDPIPENQQLKAAINFLRLRLVEPIRYLAEAEHIASEFRSDTKQAESPGGSRQTSPQPPTRITFIDSDSSAPRGLIRSEQAGGKESAGRLDSVLTRIAEQAT